MFWLKEHLPTTSGSPSLHAFPVLESIWLNFLYQPPMRNENTITCFLWIVYFNINQYKILICLLLGGITSDHSQKSLIKIPCIQWPKESLFVPSG